MREIVQDGEKKDFQMAGEWLGFTKEMRKKIDRTRAILEIVGDLNYDCIIKPNIRLSFSNNAATILVCVRLIEVIFQ